ncbi:hypothetical protein BDA96_07G084600 [Sorghum bicolor]|uniref:BTB domain-containing protein n=2 Tax=Sorghum bicolor TaxID=4558 RepID=A0A921U9W8_SORBI|nr:BTB/POZ and MATH domain-containing protein 2 [Sorghum bicolor]KAG0522986.1 hypothetical protein BDA96_07G084600 [Sorghum bicolor]KXG24747.1 hypothetical protein SORBI_3007G080900 [Sorghum bicolor]|eukprot:XP_021320696.1 BTB/POZ and MATH domain-containing protein 2 [Sorghum bicolor]
MPTSRTVSTIAAQTEQGTHVVRILGYSQLRRMKEVINSDKFSVGGHEWFVKLVLDSCSTATAFSHPDCIIAVLLLKSHAQTKEVQASFDLNLLDLASGSSLSVHKVAPSFFHPGYGDTTVACCQIKNDLFETSSYLQDDCLTIEFSITVFKGPLSSETKSLPRIHVPPSDIAADFGNLMETMEGADVTFSVGGQEFTAHRIVLATRSPVFRAQLYGPIREAGTGTAPIVIEDVQADAFRALLRFVYTDSLPPSDDLQSDDYAEMIRHLLVAADRYAMERLKLMCQSILCKNLTVQDVPTTLALADQHNCDLLRDACVEFIGCLSATDAVAATQGYKDLKRTCPSIVTDFEEASKLRKT